MRPGKAASADEPKRAVSSLTSTVDFPSAAPLRLKGARAGGADLFSPARAFTDIDRSLLGGVSISRAAIGVDRTIRLASEGPSTGFPPRIATTSPLAASDC